MMQAGERQVAPTVAGIRRDHVARYEFAARAIAPGSKVIDFACGVGYGTEILALAGHRAYGYDVDDEALAYGGMHYAVRDASFWRADARAPGDLGSFDAAVCFETIEHLEDPRPLLKALRAAAPRLFASVPNEAEFPWKNYAFHYRHYTSEQFEALLDECGWRVKEWHGQAGPESELEIGPRGRTLLVVADRTPATAVVVPLQPPKAAPQPEPRHSPRHVSIVGLGPSAAQYLHIARGLGGRHKFCDETWVINALGDVFAADRIFHMDDVRIQQIRADAAPDSNIAAMLAWLKTHPGPIVTSRAHPDYPGLEEFPLEAVLNDCPFGYFNSTAAYAIAYAIHLRVEKVTIFGFDFTYPNAHDAEKGRACVEFWLGMAAARGIQLAMPKTTTLLDALYTHAERFYGYDTLDLDIKRVGERITVAFTEKKALPSAAEVEERYDHTGHPNALMVAVEDEAHAPTA